MQRARYLAAKRAKDPAAVADIKFLVSRCFLRDMCGGASDRLQDMPYNLMLANQTDRVLLVRWEKPAPLESFLVPPPGGIDWRMDNEFYAMLSEDVDTFNLRGRESNENLRVVSYTRRDVAAPMFRVYENKEVGHRM